jgi:hypothetical protein
MAIAKDIDHVPTVEDIDGLADSEFFARDNFIYVEANFIDYVHVKYVCPICFS